MKNGYLEITVQFWCFCSTRNVSLLHPLSLKISRRTTMAAISNSLFVLVFILSLSDLSMTLREPKCPLLCHELAKNCEKNCLHINKNTCKNCSFCASNIYRCIMIDCGQDKNKTFSKCTKNQLQIYGNGIRAYYLCEGKQVKLSNYQLQCI
ncbi:uncharacterized protein LOC116305357 [Actinia tenebrosa]|uniref:Uncharacterized protein LOC116305357 n=1 Tax=Actinia tenebrosa TaxID=6105 RepID=A0A6P8IVI0_ACTTE|nr:uncharacterized protein LOC116305357 [Actinia tenebrosa]